MAWKVNCVMDERMLFIGEWLAGDESMMALCERYGISRKTGYKWVNRYGTEGPTGLCDRSRAPHRHPHAVGARTVEKVVACKREHLRDGPAKIQYYLVRAQPERSWPAVSTIGEILKTHGLVKPRRRRRHAIPSASPLAACTEVNATWCADFKGWFRTGNGARCTPLTVTDAHSRYLLCCHGLGHKCGFPEVKPLFERTFRTYGLPHVLRTDNGPPFASCGLAGLTPFAVWLLELDIRPERIRPGKPQDNGRHERMHRTLKDATAQPPRGSLRAQQRTFDTFVEHYNFERPHQALGQRPPADIYHCSPRLFPKRLPTHPDYPREWTVRKIKHKGGMMWGGDEIHISQALAGHYIGLEPTEDGTWKLHFMAIPIGLFDERIKRVRNLPQEKRQ